MFVTKFRDTQLTRRDKYFGKCFCNINVGKTKFVTPKRGKQIFDECIHKISVGEKKIVRPGQRGQNFGQNLVQSSRRDNICENQAKDNLWKKIVTPSKKTQNM